MSEAQFPSGPRNIAQALQSADRVETNARAETLPESVRAEAITRRESLRLTGEIVRANDDGSVTVRTDRGDVNVRADNQRTPPERGQRVEINIPPQREASRAQDIPVEIRHAQTEAPSQRSSGTPVNVEVRASQQPPPAPAQTTTQVQTPPPAPQQGLPPEGSVVRLQPATAQSVQTAEQPAPAQIQNSTFLQTLDFQTLNAPLQATSQAQETLINLLQTAPPTVLENINSVQALVTNLQTPQVVALQETSTAIPQNLPQSVRHVLSSITQALPIDTPELNPQSISAQTYNAPSALTPLPQAQLTAIEPAIVTPAQFTAETQPALNIRPSALDVQITRIESPRVLVFDPVAQSTQSYAPANPFTPAAAEPSFQNIITQNQGAPALTGVVTGITQAQLPLVTVVFPQISSEQIFTLQFPSENATIGTQIQVTPLTTEGSLTSVNQAAQNVPLTAVLQPALQWPALEEVLQTLTRSAPQVAQSILNITPSPASPQQLSPAILFFVAAVRGGDLSQWLGDKAQDILKAQRSGKAVSRLGNESQLMGNVARETFSGDWRGLNIPMLWQGDLQKVALYYKHEREQQDDDQSRIKSTRFVFDLTLENMGQVQLDGLFRPHSEAGTRLDLVVRTEDVFSKATQAEMRKLYALALRDSQVTGELSFQNQPDAWVTIQAKNHEGLSVQS